MIGPFRFAPFRENILLTNDAGRYAFLSHDEFSAFTSGKMPHDTEVWRSLEDKHFCFDGPAEVYYRRAANDVQHSHTPLFAATTLFIFALTNRCNNQCVYCQANGHSIYHDMSAETARKAIDRIAESPAPTITIEFQGGEPLLNFPVIKEIVAYASKALSHKKVEFALVSNLAFVNDSIAAFIAEHNISVSTSLDGPEWLHNTNRPCGVEGNSYQNMLAGKNMLEKYGVSVGAIETTTRASLPYARDIVTTYVDMGFNSVFLRPLTPLGEAGRSWEQVGYTADEFLRFYKAGLETIFDLNRKGVTFAERHATIFLSKMIGDVVPNYMELRSPCGAAIGQLAFTASGDVYTCDEGRMLSEAGDNAFRLGNVYSSTYDDWMNHSTCKAVCSASLLEALPLCCDCVYQPYCGVCPVVNYALEGSLISKRPRNDRCQIYKGMLDLLFGILMENDPEKLQYLQDWMKVG